jgi:hypothetical protein
VHETEKGRTHLHKYKPPFLGAGNSIETEIDGATSDAPQIELQPQFVKEHIGKDFYFL